jgi:hypothetical protein
MKKTLIIILLFGLLISTHVTYADNGQIIQFKDENLKIKLLNHEWPKIDSNSDGEITVNEAREVNRLDLSNGGIKSIDGLQYFTSVSDLNLENNEIVDISKIETLTEISRLNLNNNNIVDISPIEKMGSSFTTLFLNDNNISDLSLLDNLYITYRQSIYGNPAIHIYGKVNEMVDCSEWARIYIILSEQYGTIPINQREKYSQAITLGEGVELFECMLGKLMPSQKPDDENGDKLWKLFLNTNIGNKEKSNQMDRIDLGNLVYSALKVIEDETGYPNTNVERSGSLLFNSGVEALEQIQAVLENESGHKLQDSVITREEVISFTTLIFETFLEDQILLENNYVIRSQNEIESKIYDSIEAIQLFLEEEFYYTGNRILNINISPGLNFQKEDFLEAESNYIKATGWYPDYTTADITINEDKTLSLGMASHYPVLETAIRGNYKEYCNDTDMSQRNHWAMYRGSKTRMLYFVYKNIKDYQSEEAKVKLIYEFVLENLELDEYTYGGAGNGETALFNGISEMRGYTNVFKTMCILSGIKCNVVEGGYSQFEIEKIHNDELEDLYGSMGAYNNNVIWNTVEINGSTYHMDLARDDISKAKFDDYKQTSEKIMDRHKGTWISEGLVFVKYK